MKYYIPFIFLCVTLIFQGSCTYDSEEELYPFCDTLSVGYSADISEIIASNCLGCHNNIDQQGGIVLEEHSQVQNLALNGVLVCAVSFNPDCIAMPLDEDQLPKCEIDKIITWVNEGALDN